MKPSNEKAIPGEEPLPPHKIKRKERDMFYGEMTSGTGYSTDHSQDK